MNIRLHIALHPAIYLCFIMATESDYSENLSKVINELESHSERNVLEDVKSGSVTSGSLFSADEPDNDLLYLINALYKFEPGETYSIPVKDGQPLGVSIAFDCGVSFDGQDFRNLLLSLREDPQEITVRSHRNRIQEESTSTIEIILRYLFELPLSAFHRKILKTRFVREIYITEDDVVIFRAKTSHRHLENFYSEPAASYIYIDAGKEGYDDTLSKSRKVAKRLDEYM